MYRLPFVALLFLATNLYGAPAPKNYYSIPGSGQTSLAINPGGDILVFRETNPLEAVIEKFTYSGDPQSWEHPEVIEGVLKTGSLCNISCNSKGEAFFAWGESNKEIYGPPLQVKIQQIDSTGFNPNPYSFYWPNANQTLSSFSKCGLSAVSPIFREDNAYLTADTLSIKGRTCPENSNPEFDCPTLTPASRSMIHGMIPPVVGIRGETLDIREEEAGTDQYRLCWSSPTLTDSYCAPLRENFPPPYQGHLFITNPKLDLSFSAMSQGYVAITS
ncbi:MAG: hypothetical protein ACR2PX_08255 [Endozoicomonas sp.]|uniref:hypothetical protein n=1 Tax=Endozoicomonas sp. TaxID=1892382 RepID=UPI003D9BB090